MQKITSASELRNVIIQLEIKQELQGLALKKQFYLTYESFKSINLVKRLLVEMVTSPGIMSGIIKAIIQLSDRKSNRQTVVEPSGSMIKNVVSSIIKIGLTNFVVQHSDTIKLFGQYIFQSIFHKKKEKPTEDE